MIMVWTYLAYLAISIGLTVWVAHTLHKNGRIFLVDSFLGNEKLADSVNHLLVVGFYLINIGAVSVALKYGGTGGQRPGSHRVPQLQVGPGAARARRHALRQPGGLHEDAEAGPEQRGGARRDPGQRAGSRDIPILEST